MKVSERLKRYNLFKAATTAYDAVRQGKFLAVYRNMELYIGIGELNRGTNFYINWKNRTKSGFIGWKNIPFEKVKREFDNFKFL